MNRPLPSTLSIHVPFTMRKRGGRKLVVTPDGITARPRQRVDSALEKAIARAHRWQRMLDSREYANLTELAAAENIDVSFVSRLLRLTLLAPDIVAAVLVGRQPKDLTLAVLLKPISVAWQEQHAFRAHSQLSVR